MKKLALILFSIAALTVSAFAQAPQPTQHNGNQQEVLVRIQTDQPKAAPAAQKPVEVANEWVDFGKNVGTAMREGLSALTDEANKFSGTDAGRFTMAVIAWKVAGDDAMVLLEKFTGVFIGVPLMCVWISLYIWVMHNKFLTRRVLVSSEGPMFNRKKTYQVINDNIQWDKEDGAACLLSTVIFVVGALVLIFLVIF